MRRFEAISGPFQYKPEAAPAISPDGQKVLFVRDGLLWVRRLDDLEPRLHYLLREGNATQRRVAHDALRLRTECDEAGTVEVKRSFTTATMS